MAYWQFSFWAIPKKSLLDKYTNIPNKITEKDFNSVDWFINYSSESFLNSIDYLTENQHWNKDTIFFGDYDSNSIAISYDNMNKLIVEIYFRIDLRGNYEYIVKNMLNSLCLGNLIIFDENLEKIRQTYDGLMSKLKFIIDQKKLAD